MRIIYFSIDDNNINCDCNSFSINIKDFENILPREFGNMLNEALIFHTAA